MWGVWWSRRRSVASCQHEAGQYGGREPKAAPGPPESGRRWHGNGSSEWVGGCSGHAVHPVLRSILRTAGIHFSQKSVGLPEPTAPNMTHLLPLTPA